MTETFEHPRRSRRRRAHAGARRARLRRGPPGRSRRSDTARRSRRRRAPSCPSPSASRTSRRPARSGTMTLPPTTSCAPGWTPSEPALDPPAGFEQQLADELAVDASARRPEGRRLGSRCTRSPEAIVAIRRNFTSGVCVNRGDGTNAAFRVRELEEAEMPGEVLEVLEGKAAGRQIPVGDELIIGRGSRRERPARRRPRAVPPPRAVLDRRGRRPDGRGLGLHERDVRERRADQRHAAAAAG